MLPVRIVDSRCNLQINGALPRVGHRCGAGDGEGRRGRRFGVGLALVSEVAAAHGGSFTMTDAPTTGARAAIRLPTTDTRSTIHP